MQKILNLLTVKRGSNTNSGSKSHAQKPVKKITLKFVHSLNIFVFINCCNPLMMVYQWVFG